MSAHQDFQHQAERLAEQHGGNTAMLIHDMTQMFQKSLTNELHKLADDVKRRVAGKQVLYDQRLQAMVDAALQDRIKAV